MVGKLRPVFLLCSLVCIVASIRRDGSENELEECDVSRAVQVVVLFDITPVNATQSFSNQQIRLTRTLRHLDVVLAGRNKAYAVIAFHRVPVVLNQLDAANHQDVGVIIDQIQGLRPRKRRRADESSPAKALDAAAEHVAKYGVEGAKTLVLLVHDGHNTDLIAETLEATAKLAEMKADVFVITGSDHPNIPALVGYAQERAKVFTQQEESVQKTGVCFEEENLGQQKLSKPQFSSPSSEKARQEMKNYEKPNQSVSTCTSSKVDLMILLDTSGSIFHSFDHERRLAIELVKKIEPQTFSNQNLQVGLVEFATNPVVVQALTSNSSQEEILESLKSIQFTGKNTRIANAVETVTEQLEKLGRKEAKQIAVIISDGHGQEFWNEAQTAGKKLQAIGADIFAVTTSTDYNAAELKLYTGDKNNVFVGTNHTHFVTSLSEMINQCLSSPSSDNSIQNLLSEQTNSTQNSTIVELMGFPDPFQLPRESAETDTTNGETQKNSQPVEKHGPKAITNESTSQLDTPQPTSSEEESHALSVLSQRLRDQQNTSKVPDDCLTDVILLVDKANPTEPHFNYTKQLDLLIDFVGRLDAGDVDTGKIKLAAVSFGGKDANIEISFSQNSSKTQFMEAIAAINSIQSHSSFTKGIQKAIEEITAHRRSDSRLLVIVAWSGINGRDNDAELSAAADQLFNLPGSEAFAVTLNPKNKFERLKTLSGGDIFHVYVDARVGQFVEHTSAALIACTLPPSKLAKQSKIARQSSPVSLEPLSSLEKVEQLELAGKALTKTEKCDEDMIDLVVVLDLSTGNQEEIGRKKQAVKDLLRQSSADNYERRIRLALILLVDTAILTNPMISLRTSISRDDALFAIDRLEGGARLNEQKNQEQNSGNLTTALNTARLEVKSFHRHSARLALVVFPSAINSSGINFLEDLNQGMKSILELENETAAFILLTQNGSNKLSVKPKDSDTTNATVDTARLSSLNLQVFNRKSRGGYERFLSSTRHQIFECKTGQKLRKVSVNGVSNVFSKLPEMALAMDSVLISNTGSSDTANLKLVKKKQEEGHEQSTDASTQNPSTFSPSSPFDEQTAVTSALPTTTTLHPTVKFDMEEAHPTVSFLNDECKVDLMFIIDTSQSVADEFSKQLQFAVDLVKRLPDEDFSSRVQVATVTFYKSAKIQFPFGQLKEKGAVLDALFNVMHTGGSTSAVSGVELAVDEIERGARRKDARLMVVLVSDGNSQDPWDKVVSAADRLRSVNADVYAVTVSHDYFFRELELYAGNKWFVYIDARIRQFLDEAETSLVECKSPTVPESSGDKETTTPVAQSTSEPTTATDSLLSSPSTPTISGECDHDPVDLLFILDTSTSVEKEFYAEKNFALDLIKVLPEVDFKTGRISIALAKFNGTANLQFGFGTTPGNTKEQTRNDVLYSIERIEHTGGQTSLVAGTEVAVAEAVAHRRPNARLVVVIISDGNSQDDFPKAQSTAQKLRQLGGEIYAVTLSKTYYFDELKEYTGSENHIYTDEKIGHFIQEVGQSVVGCPGSSRPFAQITMAPNTEVSVTPSTTSRPEDISQLAIASSTGRSPENVKEKKSDSSNSSLPTAIEFARDESPLNAAVQRDPERDVQKDAKDPLKAESGRCKYSKMDLIIILDASTSREGVFEHQRELALSLIERLPISKDDTHEPVRVPTISCNPNSNLRKAVEKLREERRRFLHINYNEEHIWLVRSSSCSVGLVALWSELVQIAPYCHWTFTSWQRWPLESTATNTPTLRQTLGLGRDRNMVRKAIEDIKYNGGSTLTAQAVELAVEDLQRGKRPDALQVVVLMNDGVSQDAWDKVLTTSEKLASTGAERFGVALGSDVDLRELRHYIGDEKRIYRDGSTERFLNDVVSLLGAGEKDCSSKTEEDNGFQFQVDAACDKPDLDLVVLFDDSDNTPNLTDPRVNSNRYLLLDVLGSLPLGEPHLKVSIVSFAANSKLEHKFNDLQGRDDIFRRMESIQPIRGNASYAKAVHTALNYYNQGHRAGARGLFLIVGNGLNALDNIQERSSASNALRRTKDLSVHAVDSGKMWKYKHFQPTLVQ